MSDPPDPPPSKQNLLTPLLEQVFPTPVSFFSQSATASINDVVPLCLHCLMIEAGCTPLSSKKNRPPAKWNAHEDEWIVEYRHEKDGVTATFRLHCSLQRRSGRLFVHAEEIEETSGEKNIQVLGLQMTNYTKVVPEDTNGGAWGDYVKNERTLKEMFRQFIVKPLLAVSGRKALEGLREEVGAYQEVDGGAEGDVTNAEKAAAEGAGAACTASSSTKPAAEGRGEGEGDGEGEGEGEAAVAPEPELFSPDTEYSSPYSSPYSTSTSTSTPWSVGGYSTTMYVFAAAVMGAAIVGYWAFSRPRSKAHFV
jgi:hypothetical protein